MTKIPKNRFFSRNFEILKKNLIVWRVGARQKFLVRARI